MGVQTLHLDHGKQLIDTLDRSATMTSNTSILIISEKSSFATLHGNYCRRVESFLLDYSLLKKRTRYSWVQTLDLEDLN